MDTKKIALWTSFQNTSHPTPAFQSDFSKIKIKTHEDILILIFPKMKSVFWSKDFFKKVDLGAVSAHFFFLLSETRVVNVQLVEGSSSFFTANSLKPCHFQIQQMKARVEAQLGTRGWWSSPRSGTACRRSPRCWRGSARPCAPWPSWDTPLARAPKASHRRSSWRWGKRSFGLGIGDKEH